MMSGDDKWWCDECVKTTTAVCCKCCECCGSPLLNHDDRGSLALSPCSCAATIERLTRELAESRAEVARLRRHMFIVAEALEAEDAK